LPSPRATSLSECAKDSSTQKPARGQVTTTARAGLSRLTKLATESLHSVRLSKQVRAVAREYGPFDAVHIELALDVCKSANERAGMTRGIEERNVEKNRLKTEAGALLKRAISDDELLRYQLAKEQDFKCVYCDSQLAPTGFAANNTGWQTDHILPWSRFGDDSYLNKTLCRTRCNQHKKGRTPFEWFYEMTETEWDTFLARLENLKEMKGLKKRNFKLRDAAGVEDKFKKRNLTDTRWVTRLLANELKRM